MSVLKNKKCFMIINQDWYFLSHWTARMFALQKLGVEVIILIPDGERVSEIEKNFKVEKYPLDRKGKNIVRDFTSYRSIKALFKKYKPDFIITSTIKPAIIGSRLSKKFKIPSIISLNGLGFLFTDSTLKSKLLSSMIQRVIKKSAQWSKNLFLFQNQSDPLVFLQHNIIQEKQINIIPGAGVNIEEFSFLEEPPEDEVRILFAARMLWNKGIKELVESVKQIREKTDLSFKLQVAGILDPNNPNAIPESYLIKKDQEGLIEWLGNRSDMNKLFQSVHAVTLPSTYGEGIPKVLIEACASGRPIITTDTAGCREICENGKTGILVQPNDVDSLRDAMQSMIENHAERRKMGKIARKTVKDKYDEKIIIAKTIELIESVF